MNYTSIEQSKKLIELGLNIESVDMWYAIVDGEPFICLEKREEYENIPCWSVGALMEVMPLYNGTTPRLSWSKGQCVCFYYCGKEFHNDTIIDACYNMVVWLLENKYI